MKTRKEMKGWEKNAELIKVLGVNQKAGVKVGDEVEHPLHGIKTKVVAVYKDLLGNERVLTEHARRHVETRMKRREAKWRKPVRKWALEKAELIFRDPHLVIEDVQEQSILFLKAVKYRGKRRWAAVVVKKYSPSLIRTCQPMADIDKERYIKIYEADSIEEHEIEDDR